MNLANTLTLLRLLAVPFLVLLLHEGAYRGALGLFLVAGLSDAADGFVAKHYRQETRLGQLLDPIADKALAVALYVTLAWLGWVPLWLVVAVVLRDGIIVAGALAFHFLTGALEILPTRLSKLNTALQMGLVALILVDAAFPGDLASGRALMAVLVLATTVGSGVQYVLLWLRKAVSYEHSSG